MGNIFVPFNFNPSNTILNKSTVYTCPANTYAHVRLISPGGTVTFTKSGGSAQTSKIYDGAPAAYSGSYGSGDGSTHNDAMITVPTDCSFDFGTSTVTANDTTYKRGRIRGGTSGTIYADTGTPGGTVTIIATGQTAPGGEVLIWDHINVLPPGGGDRSGSVSVTGTFQQKGVDNIEFWLSSGDVLDAGGLTIINEYPFPS